MTERYGIHAAYKPNPPQNATLETPTRRYWTPSRLRLASYAQHHVYAEARDLARRQGLSTIADVGCGPAVKSARMLAPIARRFVGVDQPSVIEVARQLHPGVEFVATDLESPATPFDHEFDLVVCADVIEHLVDPDTLVDYIKRMTRPGGLIVFSTPERDVVRGPRSLTPPKAEHIREWNAVEFRAYLESRGLEIVEQRLVPEERFRFQPAYLWRRARMFLHGRPDRGCQMVVCRAAPSYL